MKIRTKVFILILLATTVPYIAVGLFTYTDVRSALQQHALVSVDTLASIQKQRTLALMDSHRTFLAHVQSRQRLVDLFVAYQAIPEEGVEREIVSTLRAIRQTESHIEDITLLSEEGRVLISTNPSRHGAFFGGEPFFIVGLEENDVSHLHKHDGHVYTHLIGPLTHDGKRVGVVLVEVRMDELFALFNDHTGLGEGGAWGLAQRDEENGDAIIVVPSRFDTNPDAPLTSRVLNTPENQGVPIMRALRGEEAVFTDLTNYRGIRVVVATRYLPELGWGIGVTLDREEVFATADALLAQLALFLVLLVLLVAFFSTVIAQIVVRPIEKLSRAAARVEQGDLDARVEVRSGDEIGRLAHLFNDMVERLRGSTQNLERRISEKTLELEVSRQELREYLDQMSAFNCKVDHAGNFILVNDTAVRACGLSKEALLKTNFLEGTWFTYDPSVADRARAAFKRAVGGERVEYDERVLLAGGVVRWLYISLSPVSSGGERAPYVVVEARDITLQKEMSTALAEAKAKDEAILASVVDGVVILDMRGTPVYANESAEKILGVNLTEPRVAKEGVGRFRFYRDVGAQELDPEERPMARLLRGERVENEAYFVRSPEHPDGRFVTLSARIVKSQGTAFGFMIAFRDVTEERAIERAKTEFVSIASHQLRTPLTTIRWYAEMLRDGLKGKLNDKQEAYAREVLQANNRLIDMVNSLLNATRLDMGTAHFAMETTDACQVMAAIVESARATIEKKHLTVTVNTKDASCIVHSDETHLAMVFQNLLQNALKYTPEGGRISLSLTPHARSGLVFVIEDSGIGVSEEDQVKLFTKLYRADNAREMDPDGTGLGLYIVRTILEKLGGTIDLRSTLGKGTRCEVWIPDSSPPQSERTAAP